MTSPAPSLPPGHPPWDPWNGARVGALAGGLAAVGLTVVMSRATFWFVPIGAAIGGVAGYRSERRKQRARPGETAD